MSNLYNLDGIKTELNRRVKECQAKLAAWENVTFPTKKDGKPFAVFSKNFAGATYTQKDFTLQSCASELRVVTWDKNNGYVKDSIDCYELVKYMKDKTMLAKKENYQVKESCLEQVYKYDLEDVKKAVSARIDYLKKYLESLKHQQTIVDECYKTFADEYKAVMKSFNDKCAKYPDIYYMIRDTVKERYPYI